VAQKEPTRKPLLQGFHYSRRITALRFAQQQVHVLRHHNVSQNDEVIPLPHLLEHTKK
jgi:hypothetical protein